MKYLLGISLLLISSCAMAEIKFVKHDFSFGSIYIPNKIPKAIMTSPESKIISMGTKGEYNFVLNLSKESYFCQFITKQQSKLLFKGKPCNYKQLYLMEKPSSSELLNLHKELEMLLTSIFYFWKDPKYSDRDIKIFIEQDRLSSIWRIDNSGKVKRVVYKSVLDNSQLLVEQEIRLENTHKLQMNEGYSKVPSKFELWFAGLVQDIANEEFDIDDFEEFCRLNDIECFLNQNGEFINLTPVSN
ncbi:hypothetical protein CW740_04525 [Kangiella profundi]|uniref:Uncharacterized protein n=1 Tax=Kangiella profundi TaxID=1561924 RepID=A0A2K9B0V4_9GAMM|nr:hypothetical protein [Kangiella profundi]AUD78558.1 hypothetical protein CW740_04525 [Kangiella profundi]